MPLEPLPQQSPHGKNSSPPKHQCPMSDPCPVRLSDVGKHYHSFPKGMFKARFTPPVLPRFVLTHFTSHPSTWTWVTKDGPNKGKSFQVPTTPITCNKTAPKAIHWMVMGFHLFKAHLNPIAIDSDTGRVKQGWLQLYQDNMYVHLQGQLKACALPKKVLPPTTKSPPPLPACPKPGSAPLTTMNPSLEHVLAELQKELSDLWEKFANYISSHEACCAHNNQSSSDSSGSKDDHNDDDQPTPHSQPYLYVTDSTGVGIPNPNPPTWLVAAVASPDIPPTFQGEIYSPD
ncbi:hypothetical protein EDC04DRAFT_3000382 [Pisolithus marmoratus]|nr:hypothetical protein EDC04DRAFT_3000382 [Pisolithus marmoratus]